MAMESSIVPLPSEFVIPPAAYLAHAHGKMSLTGIVVAGTIGSWVGATVMYWASRLLGRPLLMRYGRYVLITPEKIEQAEAWASHYGTMGVFISRLLPVIRHLIGIPAGIVRLNFWWYSLATRGRLGAVVLRARLGRRHRRQRSSSARRQRAPHLAVGGWPDAVHRRPVLLLRPSPDAPLTGLR